VKTTPGKILAHGRNKLATSAHTQGRGHKLLWCAIESHEQELDRAIARIKEQQNGETNRTGRQLTGERKTRRKNNSCGNQDQPVTRLGQQKQQNRKRESCCVKNTKRRWLEKSQKEIIHNKNTTLDPLQEGTQQYTKKYKSSFFY
jgi:hypothetical protein